MTSTTLDLANPFLRVQVEPYTLTLIALHPNSVNSANINLAGIVNGSDGFFSVTKAPGELSILAERRTAEVILHTVEVLELQLLDEPSRWKALKIVGPLDLSMVSKGRWKAEWMIFTTHGVNDYRLESSMNSQPHSNKPKSRYSCRRPSLRIIYSSERTSWRRP